MRLPLGLHSAFSGMPDTITSMFGHQDVHLVQVFNDGIYDLLEQSRRPQHLGTRPTLPIREDVQGRVVIAGLTQVHFHLYARACACERVPACVHVCAYLRIGMFQA